MILLIVIANDVLACEAMDEFMKSICYSAEVHVMLLLKKMLLSTVMNLSH